MKFFILPIAACAIGLTIIVQTAPNKAKPASRPSTESTRNTKPNIVFFLVDDMGFMDVGYNGSSFYETPNIDRLAKEGVRFNQAYSACHVCSPTRASIMTGKYPARLNLTDWLPGRKDYPFQKLKNAVIEQQLPTAEITLPEMLKANGYSTAIFGKWHLNEDNGTPLQHGFDKRLPEWNKGWPLTYYYPYNLQGLESGKEGEYLTDRLTTEAIQYIESNKDKPFFVYLSHFAVHDPIEGRPDLVKKYQQKLQGMKKPEGPAFILEGNPDTTHQLTRAELNSLLDDKEYKGHSYLPNRTIKVKQFQDNVHFAALVESVDESLGRVMAKLKELGIEDNTIVVFVSDNGGMAAANFGKPDRKIPVANLDKAYATSNLPLRGAKGWFYEGGIRVPMIIKWAGGKHGLKSEVPVVSTDFYPTLLELAGIPAQPKQHVDGKSLVSLMNGKEALDRKAIYWHFPHYSNHGQQSPGAAIRQGDYKLLEYFENGTIQLFNLKKDPGEQNDLASKEPEKVKELKGMLHAWRKEVKAQMMPANKEYVAHNR
jgi:arylsulfatase A